MILEHHHRRSIRLKGYDYTQPGAYFITLVTHERTPLFGEIVDGTMRLNPFGEIVRTEWFQTADLRSYVQLNHNEFVVMPNHVHGIIWIVDDDGIETDDVGARPRLVVGAQPRLVVGARRRRAPTVEQFGQPVAGSLPTLVRAFKSAATKRIMTYAVRPGAPVWQRNYYEHIIRSDDALRRITEYFVTNPLRWASDRENPERVGTDEFVWLEQYHTGKAACPP